MLMDAHVGEGGVKNGQNHARVINGRPLSGKFKHLKYSEGQIVSISY